MNTKPALGEEPEGLTYWDTDLHGPNPGKGGQLHALMINGANRCSVVENTID